MCAGYGAAMSTRLTYTSGAFGTEIDQEFEARLADARATDPARSAATARSTSAARSAKGESSPSNAPLDSSRHTSSSQR